MLSITVPLSIPLSLLYKYIQSQRTDVAPETKFQKQFSLVSMYPKKTFSQAEINTETLESAGFSAKMALLIEDEITDWNDVPSSK